MKSDVYIPSSENPPGTCVAAVLLSGGDWMLPLQRSQPSLACDWLHSVLTCNLYMS